MKILQGPLGIDGPAHLDALRVETALHAVAQAAQCVDHAVVRVINDIDHQFHVYETLLKGQGHGLLLRRASVEGRQNADQLRANAIVQFLGNPPPLSGYG